MYFQSLECHPTIAGNFDQKAQLLIPMDLPPARIGHTDHPSPAAVEEQPSETRVYKKRYFMLVSLPKRNNSSNV
jgi:hypothetical protein